jgi:hypothetical protein
VQVIDFLKTNPLCELTTQFGIKVKLHPRFPELVHLCYDQVASSSVQAHPIVRECRGLVLDYTQGKVVARPFDRFFNDGEGCAATIDWASARYPKKLDGSLMILYFYAGEWHVATKGSPDAGGSVGDHGFTFRELFWKTWHAQGFNQVERDLDPAFTYVFELTSPYNRVVVDYKEARLYLIGIRHTFNGTECDVTNFPELNPVPHDVFTGPEHLREAALELYPLTDEGYVVVDRHFNRIKVKSPKYVALHHIKDGFGARRIIDLIKLGETNEVLTYFPEFRAQFDDIQARMTSVIDELESAYATISSYESQKEFALAAVKTRCSAALFKTRKGQAPTVRAAFLTLASEAIQEYIAA